LEFCKTQIAQAVEESKLDEIVPGAVSVLQHSAVEFLTVIDSSCDGGSCRISDQVDNLSFSSPDSNVLVIGFKIGAG
jgi:hypothetical protein